MTEPRKVEELVEGLQRSLVNFRAEFGQTTWTINDLSVALEMFSDCFLDLESIFMRCWEIVGGERPPADAPSLQAAGIAITQAEHAVGLMCTMLAHAATELVEAQRRRELTP